MAVSAVSTSTKASSVREPDVGRISIRTRVLTMVALVAVTVSLVVALPALNGVAREIAHVGPLWLALAGALELASCASFVVVFRHFFAPVPARAVRRLAWTEMGSGALLPGGGVGSLAVGGWLIDHLIARGRDETRVRKTVLVVGMCGGLAVFGATTTTDPVFAIAWISVALSGLGAAAPVSWSLPSLIAPRGGVGTVGSIMNFANNVMGAVAPIVTGMIVGSTHSFTNAFLVAGVVLLTGVASFVFLLGRI